MQRYNRFFCERTKDGNQHQQQQQDLRQVLEQRDQEQVDQLHEQHQKSIESIQNKHRQDIEQLLSRFGNAEGSENDHTDGDFLLEETPENNDEQETPNEPVVSKIYDIKESIETMVFLHRNVEVPNVKTIYSIPFELDRVTGTLLYV